MTTSTPRRRRRRRPAAPHRKPVPAQVAVQPPVPSPAKAPAPSAPPARPAPVPAARAARCCDVATTEHCSLGGTVIRTHRHHPACPVWSAR